MAVTSTAITAGVIATGRPSPPPDTYLAAASILPTTTAHPLGVIDRTQQLSRASARTALSPEEISPAKEALLSQKSGGQVTKVTDLRSSDPRGIAKAMLLEFGFPTSSFSCLDELWTQESNWRVNASNGSSGAYGIPQALPGSKMASAGPDWRTNPETQIRWGLGYIQQRYGSPCSALAHKQSDGWY